jgi:hypothetical protein
MPMMNAISCISLLSPEISPLFAAAVFFVGAAYPKAVLLRLSREPHPHQRIARLCLNVLGVLALWGWHRIKD